MFNFLKRKSANNELAKEWLYTQLEQHGYIVFDNDDIAAEYNAELIKSGAVLIEPIERITSTHSKAGNDEYIQISESKNYVFLDTLSVSEKNKERATTIKAIVGSYAKRFNKAVMA